MCDGTTHQTLEAQNASTAVSTNVLKHLMMTNDGQNVVYNVSYIGLKDS
jgi:hypothetical protein